MNWKRNQKNNCKRDNSKCIKPLTKTFKFRVISLSLTILYIGNSKKNCMQMDVSSWNMTVIWCTHVKKICKMIRTLENLPWRDMKWMLQQRGGWMMQLNSNMINGDLRRQINRWKRGEYGGAMMTSAERSDGVKMMGGKVWKEHSWCLLLVGAHYVRVFWTSTNFLF